MISRFHYITNSSISEETYNLIEKVLDAGVNWVQLRIKEEKKELIENFGFRIRALCSEYNATFVINDHPEIAKSVGADGVHLGKQDISIENAKIILGEGFIIGGTANTIEDILKLQKNKVDYIGLGPFRYTKTKNNLSPVLGLQGYQTLLNLSKPNVPIIAIGGIVVEDIRKLLETGVHGIAVSGNINYSQNPKKIAEEYLIKLSEQNKNFR